MNIRITPIHFNRDGTPRDARLYAAIQVYCREKFETKEDVNFMAYTRAWAMEAVDPERPEESVVMGLFGIQNTIDVPLCHITPITADREGLKFCELVRDAMIYRARAYCQDLGMTGTALLYVEEKHERFWRRFLKRIGARPANRYIIGI